MSESPFPSTDSGSPQELYDDWKSHPVNIGGYRVDFNERTVTTPAGEVRNITPNSIKLLAFLLQHTNSYVSLQEVHDVIYGHQYKDDSSSRKQVTVLRKLFDDNDKEKKFIENRLGHGYRLIARVEVVESVESVEGEQASVSKSWKATLLIGLLVLLLGLFINFHWKTTQVKVLSSDKLQSLTHLRGIESYPQFSKNGRWMLFDFQHQDKRRWQIHVRDMDSGELIPLGEEGFNTRMPRWSLNDSKVIFSRFDNESCDYISADFDINSRSLKGHKVIGPCSIFSHSGHAEIWPDGKGIFYNLAESVNAPFIIYSHSFGDSASWPIAVPPPSGKGDYYYDVTDDGKRMAVLRNKNWSSTEVWVYDTRSRETKLIDTVDLILYTVHWTDDEQSIAYKNEFNEVVEFSLDTGEKSIIYESKIPFDSPVRHKNGIAIRTGAVNNRDLQKLYFATNKVELFESSSYRDMLPAVSPDGEKVAWISNRSGLYQVWYKEGVNISRPLTNIRNQIRFSELKFNHDGSMLGGTASGRWFVVNLDDYSITWSTAEKYFTNFSWTRNSTEAYVLIKDVERSELRKLNVISHELKPSGLPFDAYIALDIPNHPITYYSTLTESGFWRIVQKDGLEERYFFENSAVLNHSHYWSSALEGMYYSSSGDLYFLPHFSNEIVKIDQFKDVSAFSMPFTGKWILNTKVTPSDTDLSYFE